MSNPLFDDDLDAQFEAIQATSAKLAAAHNPSPPASPLAAAPPPTPVTPHVTSPVTPQAAQATPQATGNTEMPPHPNAPQPTPEQIAAFLELQRRQTARPPQQPSLLLPAIVLVAGMFVAVWMFSWLRSDGGSDDVTPRPVHAEVVAAFDTAATNFMHDFGGDVIAIGEQLKRGEITTVTQWRDVTRNAYTARDDEFIAATGAWDNKYVPQETTETSTAAMKDMSPMERELATNPPLTESQRKILGDYTIASGQGLQEAVK